MTATRTSGRAELQLPAPGVTPEIAHAAALTICDHAADQAEAAELLAMCGLIDNPKETP